MGLAGEEAQEAGAHLLISRHRDRVQSLWPPIPHEHNCPRGEGGSKSRSGSKIQLNAGVLSYTASGLTGRLVKILLPLLTLSGYCETFAKRNLQVCVSDVHLIDLNLQLLWLQGCADDPCSGAAASPNSLGLQTNPHIAVNRQEQPTNTNVLATSKLFVRVNKYMSTIKQ